MRSIHIFRQDLRVQDNTSLIRTAQVSKELLPVFIFDTRLLDQFPKGDTRLGFLVRALKQLRSGLQELGSDLEVYYGDSVEIIKQLIAHHQIDHVSRNRSYGYHADTRDAEVEDWCDMQGVEWKSHADYLLVEPDGIVPMKVFTPYYRRWLREPKRWEMVSIDSLPPVPSETMQSCCAISLDQDNEDILEKIGGADSPYWTVESWISHLRRFNFTAYDISRNRPDMDGTTRLSPYLRHGLVSVRQVLHEVVDMGQPGVSVEDGMIAINDKLFKNVYVSELAWREFWQQIAQYFPTTRYLEFLEKYQNIQWVNNTDWFQRRKDGTTGYPIVDAAMRQLKTENWMHGRCRMIVASFLCKDLLIDWRWGEQHFKDYLLDYDTNVNIGNRQWSASTGADPKPLRIFNPILQSQKYDPKGDYIRKWVPELAHVYDKSIHDPIKYPRSDYHGPVVDHYVMSKKAKEMYARSRVKVEIGK